MRKNHIITAAFCLLCVSCYQDIDLKAYKGEPQVVVNAIANSDTVVMADISRTWFFTEKSYPDDLDGLKVALYVNGEFREYMTYDGDKYLSTTRPHDGDCLQIQTEVDGKEVSAQDVMPEKTTIGKIETTYKKVFDYYEMEEYTYRLTLPNVPDEKRFYFVRVDIPYDWLSGGEFDYSYDPVFQLTSERINPSISSPKVFGQYGIPFSNEGCSGQEMTVSFKERLQHRRSTAALLGLDRRLDYERLVNIYSISEAYYRYLISVLSNDGDFSWQGHLMDIGYSEPVRIFSNVNGGTGIFGCVQRDYRTIFLKKDV